MEHTRGENEVVLGQKRSGFPRRVVADPVTGGVEAGLGYCDGEKGAAETAVAASEVVEGGGVEEVSPTAADEGD